MSTPFLFIFNKLLTIYFGNVMKKIYFWLMKVFKLDKKANGKVDKLEMIISILCIFNNIHLSDTDIRVLAYFMVYKINEKTDKLLINSKIVKNIGTLRNIKTRLFNLGFLKKDKDLYKSYEVNLSPEFEAFNDDDQIKMIINIDNQ